MTNFEIFISLVLIAYGIIFGIICAGIFSRIRRITSSIKINQHIMDGHDSCIHKIDNRIDLLVQQIINNKFEEMDDEIRIGDEVIYIGSRTRIVVTQVNPHQRGETLICGFDAYGCYYCDKSTKYWKKTGKHFNQIAEVLGEMRVNTNSEIEKED